MPLKTVLLDALTIEDEAPFAAVSLYATLKRVLQVARYPFRVPSAGELSWDRAALLNLTYWNASEAADVLTDASLYADVVTHAAWHHLARTHLGDNRSAAALFLGESIASAFDVFLLGKLLQHDAPCEFLDTQVPLMAEAAERAGLDEQGFEELLAGLSRRPDRAFEQLRSLLFDASLALYQADSVDDAARVLAELDQRPLAPLLHHYELSNWVLYARAYADRDDVAGYDRVMQIDAQMRDSGDSLDWLERRWLPNA